MKKIEPNVDMVWIEESIANRFNDIDPREAAYIASMESPEQVALRAWEKEYNRLPSQSFCDESK